MNFKTTLLLLVLVAAGGSLYYLSDRFPALFERTAPKVDGGTRAVLEKLSPTNLTRIEIQRQEQTLLLTRENGVWTMPGNWPTRTAEVNALVEVLGNLRSRFEAIPVSEETDLSPYGLTRPQVTVKLRTDNEKYYRFDLGEAATTGELSQFARPTYLKLTDYSGLEKPPAEVVRLAPGLIALLERPVDYYQRRRLFLAERIRQDDDPAIKVEQLAAHSIRVEENTKRTDLAGALSLVSGLGDAVLPQDSRTKKVAFALEHKGKNWELSLPETDRLDPDVSKRLLTALPDLWAERFVDVDLASAMSVFSGDHGFGSSLTCLAWQTVRTSLAAPERKITVTYDNGDNVTLLIGGPTASRSRPTTPDDPGTGEEYRFAKLENNAQVFEIKVARLKDIFVTVETLRDPRLARFTPADALSVEIALPDGRETIQLLKEKERWKLVKPLQANADSAKVMDLLQKLSALEAHGDAILAPDKRAAALQGFDKPSATVTVKWETEKKDETGESKKTPGHVTLHFGRSVNQKLFVKTDQWPRVNAITDGSWFAEVEGAPGLPPEHHSALFAALPLAKLRRWDSSLLTALTRPPLELLDPVLLQLDPAQIDHLTTKRGDKTLTLENKGAEWQVSCTSAESFPADRGAIGDLKMDLRADKFVAVGANIDWSKYGLDHPEMVATIALKDAPTPEHTLELGKEVDDVPEARYARVDKGQSVAVLSPFVTKILARSHLDYVNRAVLQFNPNDVIGIRRQVGAETLEITRQQNAWQIVKPSTHNADDKSTSELVNALSRLRAVRVVAFPATDWKTYGLDDSATVVTIQLKSDAKPSEYVLKVGKPVAADGMERFAVVGDSKAVVVLPAALSKRLAAASITFRDRSLARFADADKMRLERGSRQAVFARVAGSWKLTEPVAADADSEELDDFLNTLANLRADELVAEKPSAEELKTYGLDKPEAHWKLTAGDQEVLNLIIGGPEKVGIRRYAQLAGKDVVFLLDPRLSMRCLAEFRKRDVWTTPLDVGQVESIRFGYAKNPFVLKQMGSDGWVIEDKPDIKPNKFAVADWLDAIAHLKALHYVADKDANFKQYGLDPAETVIEIKSRSGTQTLHLGGQEGDSKNLYARVVDGKRSDVFVLAAPDLAKILRDPTAFTKAPPRPMPPIPPPPMP